MTWYAIVQINGTPEVALVSHETVYGARKRLEALLSLQGYPQEVTNEMLVPVVTSTRWEKIISRGT